MRHRRQLYRLSACLGIGLVSTLALCLFGAVMPKFWERKVRSLDWNRQRWPVGENLELNFSYYDWPLYTRLSGGINKPEKPVPGIRFATVAEPPRWSRAREEREWKKGDTISEYAVGWPLRALRAWNVQGNTGSKTEPLPASGIWLYKTVTRPTLWGYAKVSEKQPRLSWEPALPVVPLRPIWTGLVLNTLILGSPWFVIPWAWRAQRSALRRRFGHCPKCAYDRRGIAPSLPCPECGHPA